MMDSLAELERRVREADPEEAADLIGQLSRLKALARLRLSENGRPHKARTGPALDRYLTADEVAERLNVSPKWCYDHADELGAVRLSGRALRFPERSIQHYIEARRSCR